METVYLHKCTLTENGHWDRGLHIAPAQPEEARAVTTPFPNDLGSHDPRWG